MPAKKNPSTRQLRTEQLAQITEAIAALETRLQQCKQNQRNQLTLLDSVSLGLYEEIDKLAKKAPGEPVTDLALAQINDVIKETKQLLDSDSYVQRLNEFVAAGDNPQHRDAVLVLRQIRQGLDRFRTQLESLINLLTSRLNDAKGIQFAIQVDLENEELVDKQMVKDYGFNVSREWFSGEDDSFNFAKLDETNIQFYFAEAKLA